MWGALAHGPVHLVTVSLNPCNFLIISKKLQQKNYFSNYPVTKAIALVYTAQTCQILEMCYEFCVKDLMIQSIFSDFKCG